MSRISPFGAVASGLALLALLAYVSSAFTPQNLQAQRGALAPVASAASCSTCVAPVFINSLPATINSPGYYCLTSDLSAAGGLTGILIQADRVVLDLNGFQVDGAGGTGDGISTFNADDLEIRNGLVVNWPGVGVQAGGKRVEVSNVTVLDCLAGGIRTGGESIVRDCTVERTEDDGINTGSESQVLDCFVQFTENRAISTDRGSAVRNCIVKFSERGISAGVHCEVTDSRAFSSKLEGIRALSSSIIRGCRVSSGTGEGIVTVGDAVLVSHCTVEGVSGVGIALERFGRVEHCTVLEVNGVGIRLGEASTAGYCSVSLSVGDGIELASNGRVSDSTCANGMAAGVRVTGDANRVEGNHLVGNVTGLLVDPGAQDNLLVRNSTSANGTDFDFPANNTIGPTLTEQTWIQTEHPWANFDLDF